VQVIDHLPRGGLAELLDGDAVRLERLHCRLRDGVAGARDMRKIFRLDVEDVAGRGFWNHQRMAGAARHDVEKGEHMVVLIDLVAGKLAAQDFCKWVVAVVRGHEFSLGYAPSLI